MKVLSILLILCSFLTVRADDQMKMYFNNEEITKIIEMYSKASGQKFVLDPSVRGKVSIFIQEPVSLPEAFNQLSSALALNGFAISKQGDTMVVMSARNAQRNLIDVVTDVPAVNPVRMVTWMYTFKNLSAASINNNLRILNSKDGELSFYEDTNQIIVSDWSTNLNRIAEIIKDMDKPTDPSLKKVIADGKKESELRRQALQSRREEKKEEKKDEKKDKSL